MKTIKLLLCVLLTAMSLNVFADDVGRYQMLNTKDSHDSDGIFVLDTKTGAIKYCYVAMDRKVGVICRDNLYDTSGIQEK